MNLPCLQCASFWETYHSPISPPIPLLLNPDTAEACYKCTIWAPLVRDCYRSAFPYTRMAGSTRAPKNEEGARQMRRRRTRQFYCASMFDTFSPKVHRCFIASSTFCLSRLSPRFLYSGPVPQSPHNTHTRTYAHVDIDWVRSPRTNSALPLWMLDLTHSLYALIK